MAERAALALRVTLIALAAARLMLTFVPNMWAWGLNLQRFLGRGAAWGPWALGALALVPAIGRPLDRALERAGDLIARRGRVAAFAPALLAFALAWSLPDRVRYVGDFLLRQGAVEENVAPAGVFPQALPLDALLHVTLPTAIVNAGWLRSDTIMRLIGALEAALLAMTAAWFARALALRGAAAAAATAVVLCGGYLGMFTGYNKAFSEMVVLAAVVGVLGLGVVRERRGLAALGVTLAVALALHRSALAFLPAVAALWIFTLTRPGAGAPRRPALLIGVALPLATLAP